MYCSDTKSSSRAARSHDSASGELKKENELLRRELRALELQMHSLKQGLSKQQITVKKPIETPGIVAHLVQDCMYS